MGKQTIKVGLIGLGTIGGSVVKLFENNLSNINERNDLQLVLERVAERDPEKLKSLNFRPKSQCPMLLNWLKIRRSIL
jgi:homoserine dehydrogenase